MVLALSSAPLPGQQVVSSSSPSASPRFESREQLKAEADSAERQGRTSAAWLLRARLERGDFQEGDRIVVIIEGMTGASMDTLQVRSGKVLQFPRLGDLALTGVLRAELTPTIRDFLARYLQSPVVRTIPLLPLAVLGSVGSPGYYYTPADVVLRDVLMRAGGPGPDADLGKMVVRRGGEVIWKSADVRVALADGMSLDALHLRSGDELHIPQRRRFSSQTLIAMLSAGIALVTTIVTLSNN